MGETKSKNNTFGGKTKANDSVKYLGVQMHG
jgi:hypothetical protein